MDTFVDDATQKKSTIPFFPFNSIRKRSSFFQNKNIISIWFNVHQSIVKLVGIIRCINNCDSFTYVSELKFEIMFTPSFSQIEWKNQWVDCKNKLSSIFIENENEISQKWIIELTIQNVLLNKAASNDNFCLFQLRNQWHFILLLKRIDFLMQLKI